MTPRTATPVPRASLIARFGPLAAVLAAFALVAVLASTGRDSGADRAASGGPGDATSDPAAGGSAADRIPITWDEANEEGSAATRAWDSSCDPKTGRIEFPSVYAPPCVAARPGVDGGATWPGVTADSIKVVLYETADDDLAAALQSVSDPVAVQRRTREKLVEMFAASYETWGRKIEVVHFKGTGSDETSARADAVTVAEEIGAFASIGGPPQEDAYALELANRKVICVGCGLSIPDSTFQENAPYLWGTGQTPEQFFVNLGDYLTERLNRRPPIYAGDPKIRAEKERVFGIVNFEQDPPVFANTGSRLEAVGKARGFSTKVHITYQLVLPELGEKARSIIARLKEEGVTTVVFMGDPIMPIYLTKAATDQDYFPEWIISGTVLTDTTVFGRQYDQEQWAHAFGLGGTPVNVPLDQSEAWRTYEWFYGADPEAQNVLRVAYEPIRIFMLGVHMAGPDLTPETFRDGLFAYPVTGGSPTAPQVSFGNHGFFAEPDYIGVDDMREIWWKAGEAGPDEQGKETGTGMLYSSDDGARIVPGSMPDTAPDVFDEATSVAGYAAPVDEVPTYPSPAQPPG